MSVMQSVAQANRFFAVLLVQHCRCLQRYLLRKHEVFERLDASRCVDAATDVTPTEPGQMVRYSTSLGRAPPTFARLNI